MMETLEEFKVRNRVKATDRKIAVTGSWGVYDAYKAIRRHHWFNIGRKVTEKEFYAIIRGINKLLAEELVKGNTVKFPAQMGQLELRKHEVGAFMENGKLKITYPIDWASTWKLWYEDPEAFKEKTLMHYNNSYCYRVKYNTYVAKYKNKYFYKFLLNQKLKRRLSQNIKNGITDTL